MAARGVPQLVVRADAGPAIGVGHVMRCLALAHAWRTLGGQVLFVTSCEGASLRARMDEFGTVTVARAHPDEADASTLETTLRACPGAKVVIDGYHLDGQYQ